MASEVADFKIDKITFEVGGKSKGLRQIANVNDGFVVKDDIEYGSGNVVPLWAFGLNYWLSFAAIGMSYYGSRGDEWLIASVCGLHLQ